MKPTYAIATLAAAAITALGGTAALAAHPSHPSHPAHPSCKSATMTLTPVRGQPTKVVPGHARALGGQPKIVLSCTTSA